MELHPAVEPVAFLLGTWRGEGAGEYPTIDPFTYGEEVVFAHSGKPLLSYTQRTWILADGRPSHAESGYLRSAGGGHLEFVVAHPTGVIEIEIGAVRGTVIELETSVVHGTPTAKPVTALRRRIEVDGDVLRYELSMAAVGQPLTSHLRAELHRIG